MQLLVTVIDPDGEPPRCQDVLVEADQGVTLGDVAEDLRRCVGADAPYGFRVSGVAVDAGHILGEPPLLRGAILTLDRPGSSGMPLTSDAVIHLEVVGGLGAGRSVSLDRGVHVVGRGAGCAVQLDDPAVSRHHLEITVGSEGITVRDLAPTNGSSVSGIPVGDQPIPLRPDDRLRVGSTTLTHRVTATTPAATTIGEGRRRVHRPPRFHVGNQPVEVPFPRRPTKPERSRLPLIAALVPMALSLLLAFVLHSPVMMLFALLTPAMLLGQWWSDRRHGRVSHRRQLADHAAQLAEAESRLAEELERERVRRHADAPDLAAVARVVSRLGAHLWERRPEDPDYLSLRVGVGPQRPFTRATGEPSDLPQLPTLDVPAVIRLQEVGVLGVAGPRDRGLALASSLVGQLIAWHSPRDVRLVVLSADEAALDTWGWVALLPHATPLSESCLVALGDLAHDGSVSRRVSELAAMVMSRRPATSRQRVAPDVVVVLDGSQVLRQEPGIAELLRDGPGVGVHFICIDRDATRLPIEAAAQVVIGTGNAAIEARLDLPDGAIPSLVPDLPVPAWSEALARAAAPLEDATPHEDGPVLPDNVDFVEVHRLHSGSDPLDADSVARAWSAGSSHPIAVLGQGQDGPVTIDLVRDGPHALVGGTTGAGKSELLQTLVASLAVHSRPDELGFVLIDYKGGSAFRDCAGLPHVLGIVTDLDEHLTARALTSLGAELKRRERLLAEVGAKDLDDYRRVARGREPLARLVLVVDEFKVLAEELPDFVGGLIRLAAVGRSLGVHLVLATQRPAGIVSADMRANVSLRIALRVRDRSDSDDVIEAPDAAEISDRLPGRAYLHTGSRRLVPVQVAHLGGSPSPSTALEPRALIRPVGWGDLMSPAPGTSRSIDVACGPTTLQAISRSLGTAAQLLHVGPAPSPWLPPLPEVVPAGDARLTGDAPLARDIPVAGDARPTGDPTLTGDSPLTWDAPADGEACVEAEHAVPLGLVDRPSAQCQVALTWDPARDGHLGIAGGARTGRTTSVVNVALRLAERFPASKLHVHALEGSPGSLAVLAALPHVGSVTGTDDPQRLRQAIRRLAETGPRDDRRTVVLIDGWEAITESLDDVDQGESTERLLALLRDGLSGGVHAVVTGGRAVASGRVGSLLQRRLVLDMPDPVDLTLAGISPSAASRHRPPGRALDLRDESEVQLCLPGDAAADPAELARRVAAAVVARWGPVREGERPWQLLPLPSTVTLGSLRARPEHLLAGLGGEDLETLDFDLGRDERRILVVGPPRSGKSTTLRTLMSQLLSAGRQVAIVAPRRSPLAQLPAQPGLHVLRTDEADRFIELRREHVDLAVFVDDSDLLEGTPLESALVEATRLVENAAGLIAVALDSRRAAGAFRGLVPEVTKAGVGVILWPAGPADGDLLRVRVEPQTARVPGRGVLVTDGIPTPIQVALPPPLPPAAAAHVPSPNAAFEVEHAGASLSSPSNPAFDDLAGTVRVG